MSRRLPALVAAAAIACAGAFASSPAHADRVGWNVTIGGPGSAISAGEPWGGWGARPYGHAYPYARPYIRPYVRPYVPAYVPDPVYFAPPVYTAPVRIYRPHYRPYYRPHVPAPVYRPYY